jgi:hypothetical protein
MSFLAAWVLDPVAALDKQASGMPLKELGERLLATK